MLSLCLDKPKIEMQYPEKITEPISPLQVLCQLYLAVPASWGTVCSSGTHWSPSPVWHLPLWKSRSHFEVSNLTGLLLNPTSIKCFLEAPMYHNTIVSFRKILQAGSSKPWPEVLQDAIGVNKLNASALMEYFKPITDWLIMQNVNETLGWPDFNWVPPIPEGYPEDIGEP